MRPDVQVSLPVVTRRADLTPRPAKISTKAMFARENKARMAPASLLNDFILENLAYSTMHDREEEVVAAHKSTFDWVFDESAPLPAWFSGDKGPIYWITGKPGSGKSTFMRYLFQHKATAKLLRTWGKVYMAGFFFWTSGSRDQRSQTGLLRSLLHQLLSQDHNLIAAVFPDLWAKLRVMSTKERIVMTFDWTVKELLAAFERLMDAALPTAKICLFVDGLDEFEGDHVTLINFFRDLGTRQGVKMCLSSRPWSVFEDAFEHAVPHMKLQDLTADDMHKYVTDKLRSDARVKRVFDTLPFMQEKVVRVAVDRADGVFLWVRLAVAQVLARWDGKSFIVALLETLPTELDDLFVKLLFTDQTDDQVAVTSTIFQLIRAREVVSDFVRNDDANSLTIWEFAFALSNHDALALTVEEASDTFISQHCAFATALLTRRFARLLDTHPVKRQGNMGVPRSREASMRVTYIHRTVRDWLMGAVEGRLMSASPDFDAHARLLQAYVLRLKRPLEEIEYHRRLDEMWPDITIALTHARFARSGTHTLVNELNATHEYFWLKKDDPYDHWARNAFGAFEVRMKAAPIFQPFLCLAAKFGLKEYLEKEVTARGEMMPPSELENDDATPLLAYATEFLCSRQKTIFPLSDPALVGWLLRNPNRVNPGPNDGYKDFVTGQPRTPWLAVLRHLRDARRREWIEHYDTSDGGVMRWAEVVRLFIEAGADKDAVVVKDKWDPEITAVGVMELLEDTYDAVEVRQLKGLLKGLPARSKAT